MTWIQMKSSYKWHQEAVELTQSKKKKNELHPKLHTLNKKITQLWIMDLHVKWTYM